MCLLTEKQLGIVTKDVEKEGINYSHLNYDLVDHICCDVESRMNQGIPFKDAYEQVKKEFGIKGLRRIQQDTLMLIDKNYRIMKNSMKLIGTLGLALMAFGALFKIMHWPMSGLMLVISFSFISLVFFPALLYVMYKEVNKKKQSILYITGFISGFIFISSIQFKIMHWPMANLMLVLGVSLITLVLIPMIIFMQLKKSKVNKGVYLLGLLSLMIMLGGFLFKVMHWPGAQILLSVGGALLVFAFMPLFYITEVHNSEKPRIDFLFGIAAFTYFIIFSFLLSLNYSSVYHEDYSFQENSFNESANYLAANNLELVKDSSTNKAEKLIEQADLVYNKIQDIKTLIIEYYYKIPKEDAIQFSKNKKVQYHGQRDALFLLSQYNEFSPLPELHSELVLFKKFYKEIFNINNGSDNIDKLVNTNNQLIGDEGYIVSWEYYHFGSQPVIAVVNQLTLWQYNIRLAENKVLSTLISNSKSL